MTSTSYILIPVALLIAIIIYILYRKLFRNSGFSLFSGDYFPQRNPKGKELVLPGSKSSKSGTYVRKITIKNAEKKKKQKISLGEQNPQTQESEKNNSPSQEKDQEKLEEKKQGKIFEGMQFPEKESSEKIAFHNISEASSKIDNPNLREIVRYLRESNLVVFNEKKVVLGSKKEVESYIKQEIIDFFKAKLDSLKEMASELRRSGKDTKMIEMDLIMIKSKIRIFSSSFVRKDLDKLTNLFKDIEKSLNALGNQST